MNRVRKYRVWKKQRDGTFKMDYEPFVYDGECLGEFSMVNINKALANGGNAEYPESNIFMDFIGLHDKNGKEIYEGDILLQKFLDDEDGRLGVVKYEEMSGDFSGGIGFNIVDEDSNPLYVDFCEVIGNIYENPELLKGNK